MAMTARVPRPLLLVWLLATALATSFQFFVFRDRTIPTLIEALTHLAWLAFLAPHLAPVFAPLHARTRRVLLGALGVALFGQLAEQSRFTYPAVQWAMYSEHRAKEIQFLDYVIQTRSGSTRSIEPLRAFPSLGCHVSYFLEDLADASAKPGAPPDAAALWRRTLVSIGQQLNRIDGGGDPIVSLEVFRVRFDADQGSAGVEVGRESIQRVEVP